MKYNHIILCKLHLLLSQNVEILQTHIVLLIEETLLLDTCHVEHIKLSHGILELFYLLELDIVGTKHIIAHIVRHLKLLRRDKHNPHIVISDKCIDQ